MTNLFVWTPWLCLPILLANMLPPLFGKLMPIPISVKWFGPNKTWAGLIGGIIAGGYLTMLAVIAFTVLLQNAYPAMIWGWDENVRRAHIFSLASGALLGDLAKSYIKRRRGIPSGASWPWFDQADALVGAFLTCWVVDLYICGGAWFANTLIPGRLGPILLLLPLYFGAHPLVSRIGYSLKLKSVPH